MLSAEAPVFVPSWTEPGASSAPQRNCCLISLGAYSDDSDDSDSEVQSATITPAATAAPVEAPATTDEQSSSMRPRRPWRVSAPEFVPRGLTDGAAESFDAGEGASAKVAPWRRSTPSPTTPIKKAERMDSSATFSTSEGSPSPTSSVDDASSVCTGSCASRSRSPTPPPPAQQEEEAGPLGLGALLRFRSFGSERSDLALPRAAEPEPGTTAAAIAAYASERQLVLLEALSGVAELIPKTYHGGAMRIQMRSHGALSLESWKSLMIHGWYSRRSGAAQNLLQVLLKA